MKPPAALAREFAATPDAPLDPTTAPTAPALAGALALAREWAGESCIDRCSAGSHATGEGVWSELDGRPVTLSDLDLDAVLPDEAACRAAQARARAARPGLAARLLALGIAAPLETSFLTPAGLARLPVKPGTIELARRGRVVFGDPGAIASLPRWSARDVSAEERRLLLENRGFELLLASGTRATGALGALQARHARLKAVADLAAVLALAQGELPDGTGARIEWARTHALPALAAHLPPQHRRGAEQLPRLWDAALAWRHGAVTAPGEAAAGAEWLTAVQAWCAVWWFLYGDHSHEPWPRVLQAAARAPLRRRIRQGLFEPPGRAPSAPPARWRTALAGTPQHRVNGSATVPPFAAAFSSGAPALSVGALRALHMLGVTRAAEWNNACRDVVRAWDLWVLDGQRTAADA